MSRKVHSARPLLLYAIVICIFTCFFVPNRSFSATATVFNISIARQGDAPGSNITLSWRVNGANAVDIWTKTGDFDTNAANWKLEPQFTNLTNLSVADQAVRVGDGNNKWYKIIAHGTVLDDKMITREVLGKFDLRFGKGKALFSLPVEPFSKSIDSVIGRQLTGGIPKNADRIMTLKNDRWKLAYLQPEGNWKGTLKTMEVDVGYWVEIRPGNPAKAVTLVGKTVPAGRKIIFGNGYITKKQKSGKTIWQYNKP